MCNQELRQESQQHGDRDRKLQVDEEGLRKQESDLRQQKVVAVVASRQEILSLTLCYRKTCQPRKD